MTSLYTESICGWKGRLIGAGDVSSFSLDEDIDKWIPVTSVGPDSTNCHVYKYYNENNVKFRNNYVDDSISAFINLKSSSGIKHEF